ncbi:MAG: GntR family transcriptional regulator [Trueperaceae bacterium]
MSDPAAPSFASVQIDHRPLRQQIADQLEEAILSGESRPGEAIVETDVASRFGVSRAPVREALQILANRGLVVVEPYRGSHVRKLERRDVEEVYAIRTALETFAVRRLLELGSGLSVANDLRVLCDEMETHAAHGDWPRVTGTDDRFHVTLIAAADNRILAGYWTDIRGRIRQIVALRNRWNEDIRQIVANHVPIVDAVEAGDAARATELLSAHVATSADLMLRDDLFAPDAEKTAAN